MTREATLNENVLRHEWAHVEQWRRHGLVGFLVRYLWFHFKFGYAGNPFEIEAREAERDLSKVGSSDLQQSIPPDA